MSNDKELIAAICKAMYDSHSSYPDCYALSDGPPYEKDGDIRLYVDGTISLSKMAEAVLAVMREGVTA